MNKEIIEKLKDKEYVRAFGLMSPEEKECFIEVGPENCLFYSKGDGWSPAAKSSADVFYPCFTYAIKPDYHPEPEFIDLPIVVHEGRLCVFIVPAGYSQIQDLLCLPNFHGFFWGGVCSFVTIAAVARKIAEGKNVIARFRK